MIHMDVDDDIMNHPLFSDAPADLSEGHPAFMALAHLSSSSSSEDETVNEKKRLKDIHSRTRKTIAKPKKLQRTAKKTPFDKKMKELDFVTRNWKPHQNNK